MSKNKHGDLFNTSLTEIIIILFFVLMLFAIFNIDKVNKENVALGDEVDDLTFQKDSFKKIAEANNDAQSLGPLNIELTLQIGELERENRELEKKIKRLDPEYKSEDDQEELPANPPEGPSIAEVNETLDENGTGDCRDGGNWIQPKCNDYCWQIDENLNKRKFDYLIDIGVCNSSIVVQRSEWLEKRESNFLVVDGALELVNSNFISREELYEYLDMIKEPGFIKEPKQCFHMARLIDLENVSGDLWNKNGREVRERLGTTDYTASIQGHKRLKERFQSNICDLNESSITSQKQVISDTSQKQVISDQDIKPNNPVSSKASFAWDNDISCNRAIGKRTSEFNATFNVLVTTNNRVKVLNYTYEQSNRNNRLLMLDAKASIERQRKNIKLAINSENPEDNKLSFKRVFPKDICR